VVAAMIVLFLIISLIIRITRERIKRKTVKLDAQRKHWNDAFRQGLFKTEIPMRISVKTGKSNPKRTFQTKIKSINYTGPSKLGIDDFLNPTEWGEKIEEKLDWFLDDK
ncbi:hypothetical protein Ciccas_002228, partial [Cichlidogyrus casuarinus]